MAIALDNSLYQYGSGTSNTASFTCSGNNRVLVVAVVAGKSADNVTGVTYAGIQMNKLSTLTPGGGGSDRYTYLFYLANPNSGVNNIVVSASSSNDALTIQAVSYTGVDQSSYPENYNSNKQSSNSTTYSPTINTSINNCWIIGAITKEGLGTLTAGSDTVLRVEYYINLWDSNGSRLSGSNALNVICDQSRTWRHHLVSLKESLPPTSSKFFQLFN